MNRIAPREQSRPDEVGKKGDLKVDPNKQKAESNARPDATIENWRHLRQPRPELLHAI